MPTFHFTFIALLAALLTACSPQPAFHASPASTSIPASILVAMPVIRGLPSVDVHLNGRGPFRLIIDTGAEAVFLSTAAAHDAALPLTSGEAPFYATDGRPDGVHPVSLAHIQSMQIASPSGSPATFRDFDAVVRDIPNLCEFAGRRIDGLIGASVLRTSLWTLHYPFQQLTIAPLAESTSEPPGSVTLIPMGPKKSAYGMRAEIGGQPIDLLLDTGSVDAISLSRTDIERLLGASREPLLHATGSSERATYFGATTRATYHLLAPVRFGAIEWSGRQVIEASSCSSIGSGAISILTIDLAHARAIFGGSSCTPLPTP